MRALLGRHGLIECLQQQGLKALFPASGGVGAVSITADDLARLDDMEFLNDTVIDFYMM